MSIYFIQAKDGGPIKIGYSKDEAGCNGRLRHLQIGHPEPLRILSVIEGGIEDEAALHKRFGRWRLRGEWFEPCFALLDVAGAEIPDLMADAFVDGFRDGVEQEKCRRAESMPEIEITRARKTNRAMGAVLRASFMAIEDDEVCAEIATRAISHYVQSGVSVPEWLCEAESRGDGDGRIEPVQMLARLRGHEVEHG